MTCRPGGHLVGGRCRRAGIGDARRRNRQGVRFAPAGAVISAKAGLAQLVEHLIGGSNPSAVTTSTLSK